MSRKEKREDRRLEAAALYLPMPEGRGFPRNQMSTFAEDLTAIQAAQAKMATDLTTIQAGVTALEAQVQTLTTELASATLTPEQQSALDAVAAGATTLATAADAAVASLPAPPAPPTPPAA